MLSTLERGHPKSPGKGATKPRKDEHSLPHDPYFLTLTEPFESPFIHRGLPHQLTTTTRNYGSMPLDSKRGLRKRKKRAFAKDTCFTPKRFLWKS
jgi:hypothetical protein